MSVSSTIGILSIIINRWWRLVEMSNKNSIRHYLILALILAVAAVLRFWNLDLKALWSDEIITALFSLGHRYEDVPVNVALPLSAFPKLFTLKSTSCSEIAHTLATQSTHPPLFFCLMHSWLRMFGEMSLSLAWNMRSLPAVFGVLNCLAIYSLNRLAFSPNAGLIASAIMAVSPFSVYLSQEARHYTFPILIITLALIGLIQIQRDFHYTKRPQLLAWLYWIVVNSIGFYTHYFFILAFIAQVIILLLLYHQSINKHLKISYLIATTLGVIGVFISYLPWLLIMLGHFGRSETKWLPPPNNIAPIYQSLVAWILTVIALPVENQPIWIQLPAGVVMIGFFAWVTKVCFQGLKEWKENRSSIFILTLFTGLVLGEILAIAYFLRKDITIVPRYNFVYYPALCSLLGASLSLKSNYQKVWIILIVGVISCSFVVNNLAFIKPFHPQDVAKNINVESTNPQVIIMGYRNNLDIALGLSYVLELNKLPTKTDTFSFVAIKDIQNLPILKDNSNLLNLWIIAPGFKQSTYPRSIEISTRQCSIDSNHYYRVGEYPYQLYRCL